MNEATLEDESVSNGRDQPQPNLEYDDNLSQRTGDLEAIDPRDVDFHVEEINGEIEDSREFDPKKVKRT